MKNNVYKLMLPVLLVTNFGAVRAGEFSAKPIAPKVASFDIIMLYELADTLAGLGFQNLAISARDTAKILGDSFIYWTVKLAALMGLSYQVSQTYQQDPNNKTLFQAYMDIGLLTAYFRSFLGDFGKSYTKNFMPFYDFAPAPNA